MRELPLRLLLLLALIWGLGWPAPLAGSAPAVTAGGPPRGRAATATATPGPATRQAGTFVAPPVSAYRSDGLLSVPSVPPGSVALGGAANELSFDYSDLDAWDAANGSAWRGYVQALLGALYPAARAMSGPPALGGTVQVMGPGAAAAAGLTPGTLAYDPGPRRLYLARYPAATPDGQPYPDFNGAVAHELLHAFHGGIALTEPWAEEGLAGAGAALLGVALRQQGGPDVIRYHPADLLARADTLDALGGDRLAGQTRPGLYPAPLYDLWQRAAAGVFWQLMTAETTAAPGDWPAYGAWLRAVTAALAAKATATGGPVTRAEFLAIVGAASPHPVDGYSAATWLGARAVTSVSGRSGTFLSVTAWSYVNLDGAAVDPLARDRHALGSPYLAPAAAAGGYYFEVRVVPVRRNSPTEPLVLPGAIGLQLALRDGQRVLIRPVPWRGSAGAPLPGNALTLAPDDAAGTQTLVSPADFAAAVQLSGACSVTVSGFAESIPAREPFTAFVCAGQPPNLQAAGGVDLITLDAAGLLSTGAGTSLSSPDGAANPNGIATALARLVPAGDRLTALPASMLLTSPSGFNGPVSLPLPFTRVIPLRPAARSATLGGAVFAPTSLTVGETLLVTATIRNTGAAPIAGQGPPAGYLYQEGQSADAVGYPGRAGYLRLAVNATGLTGSPYRWGFEAIEPGATAVITGAIRLATPGTRTYTAGLALEGTGLVVEGISPTTVTVAPPAPTPTPTSTPPPTPTPSVGAPPPAPGYYGAYYDAVGSRELDWLLVANPARNARPAPVGIWIGGSLVYTRTLAPGDMVTPTFPGLRAGPVRVASLANLPLVVSQRTVWQGSFEEVSGVPAAQLADRWFFPWYDSLVTHDADWIVAVNPLDVPVQVRVLLAGAVVSDAVVQPGSTLIGQYFNRQGGPVEVRGSLPGTSTPAAIFASQRTLWRSGTDFNETPGTPASRLDSAWFFPWYDAVGSDNHNWVVVGNPDPVNAVDVTLKLAGTVQGGGRVPPGGTLVQVLYDQVGGPLEVRATAAGNPAQPAPVYADQRVLWGESFSEIAGIPAAGLNADLWFPWYDSIVTGGLTWLLVGNPNPDPTDYSITVAGQPVASGTLPPGGSVYHSPPNLVGGPVEVRGFAPGNPNAPRPLYASQRVVQHGNFTELVAQPLQ